MHTVTRPDQRHAGSPGASPIRVAVAGATGYAGQELLRILARHPVATVTKATSSGATASARRLPALARVWDGTITPLDPASLAADIDVVFLALPDNAAAQLAPDLVEAGARVIDLSGAFRLRSAAARARWYPETHRVPDGIAYGLTEHERAAVAGARLVANPGCYPTATLLAVSPLADAGLLAPGSDVIVDAKSGVSGAGKAPSERTHFSEVHGSLGAYGVFNHRHGAEIEQGVRTGGAAHEVTFVPHLVPLDRGILATLYVRVAPGLTEEAVGTVLEHAYAGATFVRLVGQQLPEIKHVAHTNFCDIGWRVDASGRVVLVSVIDNLVKGAAGQAVQNMNVMLGLDERTGLL
jgi:N-acetyl-gamma-glutamyl-phosphate reductase